MDAEAETYVELRFPGSPEFVRLARLVTADAGARAGLSVDAMEDLRIAVSELCAMVGGDEVEIVLTFTSHDGAVRVEGSGGTAAIDGASTEMAQALVAAVVDEHEIDRDGDRTTFRIVKRSQ
jgi:hypothetical protein